MEMVLGDMNRRGKNLCTAEDMRMTERPQRGAAKGKGYEDLGSDFGSHKQKRAVDAMREMYPSSSQSSTATRLDTRNASRTPKKTKMTRTISTSKVRLALDDEYLSSSSEDDFESMPPIPRPRPLSDRQQTQPVVEAKPTKKGQERDKPPETYMHNGIPLPKEGARNPLSGMKFKKNKGSAFITPSNSQQTDILLSTTPSTKVSQRTSPPPRRISPPAKKLPAPPKSYATRARTTASGRAQEKQSTSSNRRNVDCAVNLTDEDNSRTPRPKQSRPKPQPAHRGVKKRAANKDSFPILSPLASQEDPTDTLPNAGKGFPILSPLSGQKSTLKQKAKKDKFNLPSPLLSSPEGYVFDSGRGTHTGGRKELSLPSPLTSPARQLGTRQNAKASSSQQSSARKSNRRVISSSSEEENATYDTHIPMLRKPRPFPMETQMLESIGRSSKRLSQERSDGEGSGASRKKRKEMSTDELLASVIHAHEQSDYSDDDFIFLDPNVDPASLCPWCDEALPLNPTPYLTTLIATTRELSRFDSRPTNPLGLRAPPTAFVGVCQRHRFESYQIPRAEQHGWPTSIAWHALRGRVEALKDKLKEIVDDVDERFLPDARKKTDKGNASEDDKDEESDINNEDLKNRPRRSSLFWQDLVKRIRKAGSRKTAGVHEQFSNFHKAQPGYYGELGYVIIHQTVYELFPPTEFEPNSTPPLTPIDFIQQILVPEAAVCLIMEDMAQNRKEALETMHDSAEYGVAMFPDDHTDSTGAADAAEQIFMDRARARRKEVEEEDRIEDEYFARLESQKQEKEGKKKGKKKSGRDTTAEDDRETHSKDSDIVMLSDSSAGSGNTTRKTRVEVARSRIISTDLKWANKPHVNQSRANTEEMTSSDEDKEFIEAHKPKRTAKLRFGTGKKNVHSGDDGSEVRESGPPTSQPTSMDMDDTPKPPSRPKPRPRLKTSQVGGNTTAGESSAQGLLPFKVARERTGRQADAASKHINERSHNLQDHISTGEESAGMSDANATRRSARVKAQSRKLNYSWLLSDTSLPSSQESSH